MNDSQLKIGEKRTASDSSKRPLIDPDEFLDDTPAWAKSFFKKLVTRVEGLLEANTNNTEVIVSTGLKEIKDSVDFVSKEVKDVSLVANKNKKGIESINQKVVEHEMKYAQQNLKLQDIEECQLQSEVHQRKNNIIFSGVNELPDFEARKKENCEKSLRHTLNNIPEAANLYIGRCHRLGSYIPGRHRDIIAHMPHG